MTQSINVASSKSCIAKKVPDLYLSQKCINITQLGKILPTIRAPKPTFNEIVHWILLGLILFKKKNVLNITLLYCLLL